MKKTLAVSYKGGLGNQLFQYAFKRYLEHHGKQVQDTITRYYILLPSKKMPFGLPAAFPNIHLNYAYSLEKTTRLLSNVPYGKRLINYGFRKWIPHYYEPDANIASATPDPTVLSVNEGIIDGYWNCYQYAESVRSELLEELTFRQLDDPQINALAENMKSGCSVSLHIRMGDYLTEENQRLYGGACTPEYYAAAIAHIRANCPQEPIFYVFSNDIPLCKQQYDLPNVVWMDDSVLPPHPDWVEMYLMSCCRHNIIANSTFSWWGAWLNRNPGKIVVAPLKWLNQQPMPGICPPEWTRL